MRLVDAALRLASATAAAPLDVPYVYHPLSYAWEPHEAYLRRYGAAPGRVVLVGMNPGPWGMAQTGVPFADPFWARGWMGLEGRVGSSPGAHPARPVLGYASARRDPSGAKLYGWAQARFGTAERFFSRFFVTNHCPVMMLDDAGRNLPPTALRRADRELLLDPCDAWLADALAALAPSLVVALGSFVHERILEHDLARGAPVRLVRHPSPVNPANNAGWGEELDDLVPGAAQG